MVETKALLLLEHIHIPIDSTKKTRHNLRLRLHFLPPIAVLYMLISIKVIVLQSCPTL